MTEDQSLTNQATREPSQYETAMTIAARLDETDERRRRYIVYLVQTLGRTQARRLLNETLQTEPEGRTRSEIYFHLAETKGKPKRETAISPFRPAEVGEPSDNVEVARMLAETLGETEQAQFQQILHIVRALGQTQARTLLQETLDIEQSGGMMLPNGSRRRTPGGVFFHLVYTKGRAKAGYTLKRPQFKRPEHSQPTPQTPKETPQPVQPVPVVTFTWGDRIAVIQEAQAQKGTANVKITVVGRPGKVVDKGQCVVTVMESSKVPALPKGLPTPPTTPTTYTVYIGAKQWKKVAEAIADPEDTLIVEGFPTMDQQTGSIAVFATNTTTKKLQMAQKTKQQATTA